MIPIALSVGIVVLRRLNRRKRKILVLGSVNIDLFVDLEKDNVVEFGEDISVNVNGIKGSTLRSEEFLAKIKSQLKDAPKSSDRFLLSMKGKFVEATGGKGANTSAAAATSGRFCEFIGNFGKLSDNTSIFKDLNTYGNVSVDRCQIIPDISTGTAFIMKFPDGDNTIALIGGANQAKWVIDRPGVRSAIREASVIMLQREIPNEANVSFAKLAHSLNIPVLLDVGGSNEPVDRDLVPFVSVVMPNESELKWISGCDCVVKSRISMKRLRDAVSTLRSKWNRKDLEILVTLGKHGAIYFTKHGLEHRVGAYRDVVVNDTTGAGDCFRGSFAAARYTLNFDVLSALRWASAAASLCVEVPGAMPSMPSRESIEHRLTHGKIVMSDFDDE